MPSVQLSSWSLGRPPCCGRFGVVMELFNMADEAASSSVKFDVMVKLVDCSVVWTNTLRLR